MRAQQASIQPTTFPAPIKGINSILSLAMVGPEEAIYCNNIDPSAYGLRVRPGVQEYADGFGGDSIKTVIPYRGRAEDNSDDKLFALTSAAIYDISASTDTPTNDYTWAVSTSDPAGYAIYDIFTNDAGVRVLLVTDAANGLVNYVETTDSWAIPTVTGVAAADLVFIATWKTHVWYIEKDTNSAWYSAAGTFAGALTEFNFGNKFSRGGHLKAIYNWTLDSGEGPDDYLVALSSAGDVVVYQGTDPSAAATFSLVGVWFVGEFPAGRRVGTRYGGDLLLLSSYGIISCMDLVRGANPFTLEGSVSYKINRSINFLMRQTINTKGWEVVVQPDLAKIIVSTPKISNQPHTQFVYDVNLQGWSTWTGVPYFTGETHKNKLYVGADLTVYSIEGNVDDLSAIGTSNPQPIAWSFLSGFSELETPQMNKIVEFIRPKFIAAQQPVIRVKAYYDNDLSQIVQPVGSGTTNDPVWDTSLWDAAIWGGASEEPFESLLGSSGIGRKVAIAMSGSSADDTVLVDSGIMYRSPVNSRGML